MSTLVHDLVVGPKEEPRYLWPAVSPAKESIVRSFRVSQVLWKPGQKLFALGRLSIVIQDHQSLSPIFPSSSNYGLSWLIFDIYTWCPSWFSKEYLLTATTTGKSLHPIILIFDQQPTNQNLPIKHAQPAFQIKTTKSDARRLSNYLNQSLDQFFN